MYFFVFLFFLVTLSFYDFSAFGDFALIPVKIYGVFLVVA